VLYGDEPETPGGALQSGLWSFGLRGFSQVHTCTRAWPFPGQEQSAELDLPWPTTDSDGRTQCHKPMETVIHWHLLGPWRTTASRRAAAAATVQLPALQF
jgi:hypothetical protein